jgi:hypothetical protein
MTAKAEPRGVFVNPAGSDGGNGDRQHPFRSLHRAIAWIAKRRSDVPPGLGTGDLIVQLEPGIYRLKGSVMIGPEASGCATSRTVIRGAAGVVITGNEPARPRKPLRGVIGMFNKRRLTYVDVPPAEGVPLDLGTLGSMMPIPPAPPALTVAGRRLDWVRRPAVGWLRTVAPGGDDGHGRHVLKLAPSDLAGQEALWVEAIIGFDWAWYRSRVHRLDATNGHVILDLPATGNRMLPGGDMVAFLNDRKALRRPGTCWLDPGGRRIFYLEETPGAAAELCVNPGHLVRLARARHVVIESLHFAGGLASAIEAIDCSDITIENCQAEQFSLSAFHLEGSHFTIRGCAVNDVGITAVRLLSGDAGRLIDGKSVIEGCTFKQWGRVRKVYEPAVKLHGTGTLVRGCTFTDGPHMAIEVVGNSHRIDGNEFSRVAHDIDDMGAIYFNLGEDPLQRGHVVSHNLFHDIGLDRTIASAVYVDRCSMGITVFRNIFIRICGEGSRARRAIHANGASHLKVVENLFVDCECALELEFYLTGWGKRDVAAMIKGRASALRRLSEGAAHASRYPELLQLAEEDLAFPATNQIRGNYVLAPNGGRRCGFVISGAPPGEVVAVEDNVVWDRGHLGPAGLVRLPPIWRPLLGKEITVDGFDAAIAALIADWNSLRAELFAATEPDRN